MFLFKLLVPLLLYAGCNPYFPTFKPISFLYWHLKFLCHIPVKCSQIQIRTKSSIAICFTSLILLSFSQYHSSLTGPTFRTVESPCRIHPLTFYIDGISGKFPCHQTIHCLPVTMVNAGLCIPHKCIQITVII